MTETIKGIQDSGVVACAKHYIMNEQEHYRDLVHANVDDKTMHELYLWYVQSQGVIESCGANISLKAIRRLRPCWCWLYHGVRIPDRTPPVRFLKFTNIYADLTTWTTIATAPKTLIFSTTCSRTNLTSKVSVRVHWGVRCIYLLNSPSYE
jgi:hypothetical protein